MAYMDLDVCKRLLNSLCNEYFFQSRKKLKKVMDMSVRIAEMLLDAGCDATQANIDGQLPISLAVMEVGRRT